MYASVIVDISHSDVDRTFTYALPDVPICPGQRVLVPFGRGNKPIAGLVLSFTENAPQGTQMKHILRPMEPYAAVLPDQLSLAEWVKETYHCTMAEALRLMIPAQLRGGKVHEKVIRIVQLNPHIDLDAAEAALLTKSGKPRAPKQYEVFRLLRESGAPMSVPDLNAFLPDSSAAIRALLDKGFLTEEGHITFRSPWQEDAKPTAPLKLNEDQQAACDRICEAITSGGGAFLLHGVTGSGKTEVYLQALAHAIREGKSGIVLVPEIALTPQTVERFRGRFGDRVAVLHSRLSDGERFDEWRRIRQGRVDVVVGARSAVFAPLQNLGLIIVDEEHETSYHSEKTPCYHANEISIKRCQLNGGTLVLGSATPSVTSYHRAENGRYELLKLPNRVADRPLPNVTVADMREEFAAGNTSIFSAPLHEKLTECLNKGQQAILFLNRRGYSTFVSCRGCGYVFECDNCDVSMTYHKTGNFVKCHYCGSIKPLPTVCPVCGKKYIKYFGIGTQQVEEQVQAYFPGVKTLRMDMDTTRTKDAHHKILSSFAKGEAQVLIGTQMIAKGLDIPNVTLVGVIAADSTLHIPDYRSCERAFQLITQVAGRAGRDKEPGEVVVQTYTPEHPVIQLAAQHDYEGFYAYESKERKAALFPPYSLFVRTIFTGREEQTPEKQAERFAAGLRARLAEELAALGADEGEILMLAAAPAPVKKRQGMYRYQVLLKLVRTRRTAKLLAAVYDYADTHRGECFTALCVNPEDMF